MPNRVRRRSYGFAGAVAALSFCAFASGALSPARADAQTLTERLSLRLAGGAGSMLPEYQRTSLRYVLAIQGAAGVAVEIIGPLALQATFASTYFPSDVTPGQEYRLTGGLRLAPRISTRWTVWVDANAGAGWTAALTRFALDAGAGIEFDVARYVTVGAWARYNHLFANGVDFPSDAGYVTAGLSLSLHFARRAHDEADERAETATDRDRDRDGVDDAADQCPAQPAGARPDPQRPGCPIPDRDGDGVLDANDRCPNVSAGAQSAAGRPGCPALDRDGDSVLDDVDACPDRFGVPSRNPQRNGCPRRGHTEGAESEVVDPLHFERGVFAIDGHNAVLLGAVVAMLDANPAVTRLGVYGHADDRGPPETNQRLSELRAAAARDWLLAHGVEASRLETRAFGETEPLIPSTSERARAQNRRVEFIIVDYDPSREPAATPGP